MTQLCLYGGRVLDPASGTDDICNVYIRDGRIAALSQEKPGADWETMDVGGCWVTPGLIDMHVHLRQPGREDVETIETGTQAAVCGGVTSVMCMPNTIPPIDGQTGVEFVRQIAHDDAWSRVYVVGAITKGQLGEELAEIGEIVRAGAVAISDDGFGVMNAYVMRRALEYAKIFGIPVVVHAEDRDLSAGGAMNEGAQSTLLGLPATPVAAEAVQVARDAILTELTGSRLHIGHISARHSVDLLRFYQQRGASITAEATPHHFTLTEERVEGYRTDAKMSPPLRSADDRDALIEGLFDGCITAIASDHAPHSHDEKALEFDHAPNGIVGLETLLSVSLTELYHKRDMDPLKLVSLLTTGPAGIASLPGGTLQPGRTADVTVIDPEAQFNVDRDTFATKGRNTPFHGYAAHGRAVATIIAGVVAMRDGQLVERPPVWQEA